MFPYKFAKTFKGLLFLYQKFLDVKILLERRNLREFLISIIKIGGFFIRVFGKRGYKIIKIKKEKAAFRTASQS